MKTHHPWYRRFPVEYRNATRMLSLEARAVYIEIIDAIYEFDGPIEACPNWLGCHLHIHPKVAKRLRDELVAAGKIRLCDADARIELAVQS